jgi:hypothetical protein
MRRPGCVPDRVRFHLAMRSWCSERKIGSAGAIHSVLLNYRLRGATLHGAVANCVSDNGALDFVINGTHHRVAPPLRFSPVSNAEQVSAGLQVARQPDRNSVRIRTVVGGSPVEDAPQRPESPAAVISTTCFYDVELSVK